MVDSHAPEHLTRLVAEKVISRKALPETWELLVKEDDITTLRAFILTGATHDQRYCRLHLPSLGLAISGHCHLPGAAGSVQTGSPRQRRQYRSRERVDLSTRTTRRARVCDMSRRTPSIVVPVPMNASGLRRRRSARTLAALAGARGPGRDAKAAAPTKAPNALSERPVKIAAELRDEAAQRYACSH